MKIITLLLLLVSFSGGCFWFITKRSNTPITLPSTTLNQLLEKHNALFACANIRSIYVKNPWGDLGIKADYATFTPKQKLLMLTGNVNIHSPQGIVTTDEASVAFEVEQLSCRGDVRTEVYLPHARTQRQ